MKKTKQPGLSCPKGEKACPIYTEIEQLKAEVEELRTEVVRDYLTGLHNTRYQDYCLGQEMERSLRSGQPTTLIMLDIDHFKSVNDRYGHAAGDMVLKHIAKILVNSVRKLDICCRSGGEEFSIILPSTHLLVGIQVAKRIRGFIEDAEIQLTEGDIRVTASFGVSTFQHNSEMSQQAFKKSVDAELYRAKKAGRNQVCFAARKQSDTRHISADERAALLGDDSKKD